VVAGFLRLTLAPDPGGALVTLENRDLRSAQGLTLEVLPPPGRRALGGEAEAGQVFDAAGLVRWYVPELAPGAALRLTVALAAEPGRGPGGRWCALLLSAPSPLESCAELGGGAGSPTVPVPLAEGEPTAAPDVAPDAAPIAAPTGESTAAPGAGSALGEWASWALVLAGLGLLGAWLGLRRRGPAPAPPADAPADDEPPAAPEGS
jgi:hypothetical protein